MSVVDAPGRHTLEPAGGPVSAPTFSRLFRAEVRRLLARRFFLVLVGIGLIGYILAIFVVAGSYSKVTPEVLADATARRDQSAIEIQQDYQSCRAEDIPDDQTPEEWCGPDPTTQTMDIEWFIDVDQFSPAIFMDLTIAVGAAVGMLALFLGATFIGAEWSSKNLVAWLFWEPRRHRLLGAKIGALLTVVLALSVVAQVVWYFAGRILMSTRGITVGELDPPQPEYFTQLFQLQVRAALFVVPAALLGFGLANLMKNTAATLGVALVYLLGVEPLLAWIDVNWTPFQFTSAALGWLTNGGITYYGEYVYDFQQQNMIPEELHISNTQGGLVLLAYAAVVTLFSIWLFRRRDVT